MLSLNIYESSKKSSDLNDTKSTNGGSPIHLDSATEKKHQDIKHEVAEFSRKILAGYNIQTIIDEERDIQDGAQQGSVISNQMMRSGQMMQGMQGMQGGQGGQMIYNQPGSRRSIEAFLAKAKMLTFFLGHLGFLFVIRKISYTFAK